MQRNELTTCDFAATIFYRGGRGFSLVEIMIALVILASVAGSIFAVFSASKGMLVNSREISTATSLAGSYLAAASSLPAKDITVFAPADESELPEPFRPENLRIPAAAAPFKRTVSLLAHDLAGKEGGPFYQVRVEISWKRHQTGVDATYISSTLLRGVE